METNEKKPITDPVVDVRDEEIKKLREENEKLRKENEALKRDIEYYKGLIAHAAEVREGLERKLNVIREVLAL